MSWSEYYKTRVNSQGYIEYFENKYVKHFRELLKDISLDKVLIKEECCGIGNVSKCLNLPNLHILSDLDDDMLELAEKNIDETTINYITIKENIVHFNKFYINQTVVFTHGVLEHFSDEDLELIKASYNNEHVKAHIHYVPLEGYGKPSKGDERLLSCDFWIKLFNPDKFINIDNKDLFFICKIK